LTQCRCSRNCALISFDLRGHGDSDKPLSKDAYHDPARWAHDLRSVVRATGADRPCLVAWSYGGRVLNDYLSVFGDAEIGALNYVAATSSAERFGLGRSYALIVPMLADNPEMAARGTEMFLKACFEKQPTPAEMEAMKRFNAKTPVAVRKLLAGRAAPYEAVLRKISVPTLITHGAEDQISALAMSEYTRSCVPGATLSIFEGVGHSTFFEDPQRFNRELISLARSVRAGG
jgi:non-heme chloroperoxidase